MAWQRVDQILDLLFPPRCLLCGDPVGESGPGAPPAACPGCRADLPWLPDGPAGGADPALDAAYSALLYEYPVDRLVAAAKFGRRVHVAQGLGRLLASRAPNLASPPDAVVPVPLHWRRESHRGFNQAEEIARVIAAERGWPLRTRFCHRARPTAEQSALGAGQRRENLRAAFALRDPAAVARCRHVLLVDDVLTTGATLAALASLFRAAGVPRITAWTVAWTPPQAALRQPDRKV